MPSDTKTGTLVRNALINAVTGRIDSGAGAGRLRIRIGTPPTNLTDASTGTLLAEFVYADPAYGQASGGEAVMNPVDEVFVQADGTAGYFRAYADGAADTECEFQGTVGEAADDPDLQLTPKTVTVGGWISIQGGSI